MNERNPMIIDRNTGVLWNSLIVTLIFALTAPCVTAETTAESESTPTAVVEAFQNELIAVMKAAPELGYRGRYARLAPAVRRSHDIATISRISVGSYWDGLDRAQQARLVETFGDLSISTYAERFDGYSGERFDTQSSGDLSAEVAGVRSLLMKADGGEIQFDYVLHKDDRGWRIVNIVVDGVSDLALKRAEYAEILSRDGFHALIAALKEKIAANAQ
ncbi:MAG: ABC transporter substrate-binding protein [Gammaproteobacteria bacterium]